MANQDKIIRITADTSPLRNIRQEVQGLTGDIGELARSIKAKVPSLSDLGKRIEPIIQRGVDSAFGTDEPKIERPITPAPEEYIPDPEKVRELEELSRDISEPRVSPVTEEQPVIERPEVREEEAMEFLISYYIANKQPDTEWIQHPTISFDCYLGPSFSKKYLPKIPRDIITRDERQVGGTSRYKVNPEFLP